MILLTPGPCMTSESVRKAAAMPDMSHRDPAFIKILRDTKQRLLRVYPEMDAEWRPYLIGGSGTAAVEAMITSCIDDGPVLLIDSGYYSSRMSAKLQAHGIPFDVLTAHNERVDEQELSRLLTKSYEAVITTHHETSTGRLHDLNAIGRICQEAGARLLVDGMSSFGADPIDLEFVDALATSANKCLHGLPGLSMVFVRDWLADQMREYAPRTVYLSLPFYAGDSPPLTPPVPILNALRQALIEMGGGAEARSHIYRQRASILRQGLKARGFQFAIPEEAMSCTLTTASIPSGWSADAWFQANLDAGFMIYGTKGEMREKWFQVANMGEITHNQLELWLANVDDLLAANPS